MTTQHCDEDLGGLTLRHLLSLQPTAGPEPPVWLPDGSAHSGQVSRPRRRHPFAASILSTGAEQTLAAIWARCPFSVPLSSPSPRRALAGLCRRQWVGR